VDRIIHFSLGSNTLIIFLVNFYAWKVEATLSTRIDVLLMAAKQQAWHSSSIGVMIAMTIYSTANPAPSTDIEFCLFTGYA